MVRTLLLISALLLALPGCAQNTPTPAASPVPSESVDELIAALRAAGAAVEEGDAVTEPFFSVPGRTLMIGEHRIYAFQYPDEAARQQESNTIQPDGFGVGGSMVDWVDQPHFWADGNLIVLYVGRDQVTLSLISSLLGKTVNRPPG